MVTKLRETVVQQQSDSFRNSIFIYSFRELGGCDQKMYATLKKGGD
jgi:hypothetical protein